MASSSAVLRLDAAVVDPATVAYLRDLVDALQGKCFHLACENQIDGYVTIDLFRLRPEPSLLPGVPDEVASAVKKLEELLRRGSPALEAFGRHVTRLKRDQQEGALGAAMSELQSVDDVIAGQYDVFVATRAHLLATQYNKQQIINRIAAVVLSSGDDQERLVVALISLIPRLGQALEREAVLEMAVWRMNFNLHILSWHLEAAKGRVEAVEAALQAIPDVPGDWADDVQIICDASARFEDSACILREYMA